MFVSVHFSQLFIFNADVQQIQIVRSIGLLTLVGAVTPQYQSHYKHTNTSTSVLCFSSLCGSRRAIESETKYCILFHWTFSNNFLIPTSEFCQHAPLQCEDSSGQMQTAQYCFYTRQHNISCCLSSIL